MRFPKSWTVCDWMISSGDPSPTLVSAWPARASVEQPIDVPLERSQKDYDDKQAMESTLCCQPYPVFAVRPNVAYMASNTISFHCLTIPYRISTANRLQRHLGGLELHGNAPSPHPRTWCPSWLGPLLEACRPIRNGVSILACPISSTPDQKCGSRCRR